MTQAPGDCLSRLTSTFPPLYRLATCPRHIKPQAQPTDSRTPAIVGAWLSKKARSTCGRSLSWPASPEAQESCLQRLVCTRCMTRRPNGRGVRRGSNAGTMPGAVARTRRLLAEPDRLNMEAVEHALAIAAGADAEALASEVGVRLLVAAAVVNNAGKARRPTCYLGGSLTCAANGLAWPRVPLSVCEAASSSGSAALALPSQAVQHVAASAGTPPACTCTPLRAMCLEPGASKRLRCCWTTGRASIRETVRGGALRCGRLHKGMPIACVSCCCEGGT
jgi:hypothetical protein